MTGIDRAPAERDPPRREFPPGSTWSPRSSALIGVVAAGLHAGHGGGSEWLAVARFLVGAAFLGAVTDAMLLGHWYLVQPGLARGPAARAGALDRATCGSPRCCCCSCPSAWSRCSTAPSTTTTTACSGWFWVACAVTTGGLVVVTRLALKERYYSAVMAATGLLYLAILTAFGTDLVARALLS